MDGSVINKIKKAYIEGGLRLIFKRFFKISFSMNHAYWFERDLLAPLEDHTARIPVKVDMHGSKDTLRWLESNDKCWMLEYGNEIKIGIEQGHYYPNIRHEGKIIGSAKVGFNNVYISDFKRIINFPDKIAYHTDINIDSEYREKGIAKYFLCEIMQFLKEKGFKKLKCHIPLWNKASIKVHEKVGFKKINHIYSIYILGLKIITSNPGQ